MRPHQLIETAKDHGMVNVEIAHRAVKLAEQVRPVDAMTQPSDRQVCRLSPDAALVIDASGCIVLVVPGHRVTVTNVGDWQESLSVAQQFAAIYEADAGEQTWADLVARAMQESDPGG